MGSTLVEVGRACGRTSWSWPTDYASRLALDDWLRMDLGTGQRIPVRLPGATDAWLFITNVTELPPVVWVVMAKRVKPRQVMLEGMA